MNKLLTFINGMAKAEREAYFLRVGCSEAYVRKCLYAKKAMGSLLCLRLAHESAGAVAVQDLADENWADVLRMLQAQHVAKRRGAR